MMSEGGNIAHTMLSSSGDENKQEDEGTDQATKRKAIGQQQKPAAHDESISNSGGGIDDDDDDDRSSFVNQSSNELKPACFTVTDEQPLLASTRRRTENQKDLNQGRTSTSTGCDQVDSKDLKRGEEDVDEGDEEEVEEDVLQEEKEDSISLVMPSSSAAAAAVSRRKRKLGSCNNNSNNGKDLSHTTGSDSNSFGISMKGTEMYQTNNNIPPSARPILAVSSCRTVTCNCYDCVVIRFSSYFIHRSFERIHIPLTV